MPQMIIMGRKRSKGTLDNGNAYDSTKLYIQTALKATKDQDGFSVAEYTWGDSSNYAKLDGQSFPLTADVSLDIVSTGKSNQVIITDVALKPVK